MIFIVPLLVISGYLLYWLISPPIQLRNRQSPNQGVEQKPVLHLHPKPATPQLTLITGEKNLLHHHFAHKSVKSMAKTNE